MSDRVSELRALSDEIGEVIGTPPFGWLSVLSPTRHKVVFQGDPVSGPVIFSGAPSWVQGRGMAYLREVQARVRAGTWEHFTCPACPQRFTTQAARDEHMRSERHRR